MISTRYFHYHFQVFVDEPGSVFVLDIIRFWKSRLADVCVEPNIVHVFTIDNFNVGYFFSGKLSIPVQFNRNASYAESLSVLKYFSSYGFARTLFSWDSMVSICWDALSYLYGPKKLLGSWSVFPPTFYHLNFTKTRKTFFFAHKQK